MTQSPRIKFFIGGALILAAVIYLIVSSTQASAQYFMTIDELNAIIGIVRVQNRRSGAATEAVARIDGTLVGWMRQFGVRAVAVRPQFAAQEQPPIALIGVLLHAQPGELIAEIDLLVEQIRVLESGDRGHHARGPGHRQGQRHVHPEPVARPRVGARRAIRRRELVHVDRPTRPCGLRRKLQGQHPGTGEVVDNCQHVLLGCCTNLIDFYRRIGVEQKIRWYDRLTFLEPGGRRSDIVPSFLPAPFHHAPAFLKAKSLGLADKLGIARALGMSVACLMLRGCPRRRRVAGRGLARRGDHPRPGARQRRADREARRFTQVSPTAPAAASPS